MMCSKLGYTVNVDVSELLDAIRSKDLPFFLTLCYCVSEAANRVDAFRQRILDGHIIEYDHCRTSHTVALDDGTYCCCDLNSDRSFEEYIGYAMKEQERAKRSNSIDEDEAASLDRFFI